MDTQNLSPDFFAISNKITRETLSFCDTNVKSIQQWAEQLNSSQLGDSSKALLNAIIEISELQCQADIKYQLIQTLHPLLEQTISFLEKNFITGYMVNSGHQEGVTDLTQLFRSYLARIYNHITFELSGILENTNFSIFSMLKRKNLQQIRLISLYLALEQLNLLKYQQLLLYKSAKVGQWRCAHQLYDLARQHNFDDQELKDKSKFTSSISSTNTILDLYKQINLLDLLNTHQLRPVEIYELYQCSFQWIKLIKVTTKESSLSRYVINLNKDFPPIINNFQNESDHQRLFLETQALYEHINLVNLPGHKSLSKLEKDNLTPSLVFHVLNILNNSPERRFERYNFTSSIQITFSLQSAHYYLSNATPFEDTLQKEKDFKATSESQFLSSWHTDIQSTWEIESKPEDKVISPKNYSAKSRKPILDDENKRQVYSCTIIDISVNGYRMKWSGDIPKQLRTGELILVQENKQSPWRAGVIRWLKQVDSQHIEFGIEILSQDITPCAVQLFVNKSSTSYHPALLVKKDVLNETSLSIIVPGSQFFKEQQSITLRLGTDEIKIYLTNAKLINQSFTLLDFDLLDDLDTTKLNSFIQWHAESIKKLDLWDSLK
ncbi:GTPase [Acinetobacter nectaris]|uniref:GTPase n=1 Tax=Acinetobacter nectaris TaxID=1219382 RepID=UPI001F45193E|nr:GTPase [Acinetobacter nectaris]MCF8999308.1 GTPase [Acinetobacter nectaris]MCF9028085.1 GTPase [Acinetobacter nectaris]